MRFNKKILSVLLLFLFTLFLVSCGGNKKSDNDKTIPVYQGMVLQRELVSNTSYYRDVNLLSGTSEVDDIDQDDPYDNFDNSTIESEIKNTLDVITSTEVEYYANQNEELLLTIKLLNPDNFVILSFTLNGTFYQSYQFQDGSDSENLILKVNSGAVSGIKEYTIDAIKYIDGTEINDVVFAGDRTVKLGVTYKQAPMSNLTDKKITPTSVSFNVNISDQNNLIAESGNILKAVLYDGESLIKEMDLALGVNLVVFDKLNPDRLYQYAVYAVYDILDNNGSQVSFLEKEAFYTHNIVNLTNINASQNSISFDIFEDDLNNVGSVTSIMLYQGETLKETLTDLSLRTFDELLSNNEYTIKVIYTYDLNDGIGAQTITKEMSVTTLAKATPEITITDVTSTQTSVSFELEITDTDQVGTVTSIELYKGITLVETLTDLSLRTFDELLSNNEYTIKVVYTYDLNDGVGAQTITKEMTVKTLAKATPTLEIIDILETQESVSFDLEIKDTDQVGLITSIELYLGSNKVATLESFDVLEFSDLLSNNLYEISVVYSYDLNDGEGTQELNITKTFTTIAYPIEITGTSVLNTANPKTGEEVHIRVNYNNPSKLNIKAFYVNGEKVLVTTTNTATNAIFKFVPDFEGGIYEVNITGFEYESFGVTKSITIENNFTDSILIMGSVGIESITEENNNSYIVRSKDNYLNIEINNPTGYQVTKLVINDMEYLQNEINMIDNNLLRVKVKGYIDYSNYYEVKSITYGMEGYDFTTKTISGIKVILYGVNSDEIRYISTIEALQNLEDGYIYKLTNDINADGFKWVPYEFEGVLLGNNYVISNLSIVIENESKKQQYYGLFSVLRSGLVDSVGLVDAYISIKTLGRVNVGGLVGYNRYSDSISNSYVSGTTITVTTESLASVGGLVGNSGSISNNYVSGTTITVTTESLASVGGLVGSSGSISNSYVSGTTITVTSESYAYVGGLVGYSHSSSISNNYVSGTTITVTTESHASVGGLVGSSDSSISNSYVSETTITVTSESYAYVGGLVGYSHSSSISNSYVSETTITVTSKSCAYVGGLAGYSHSSGSISNSYVTFDVTIKVNDIVQNVNDELIEIEELDNKSFYIDVLGWNESIWNFDDLDYNNNKYPTLKQ